jgi:hypothetical protein
MPKAQPKKPSDGSARAAKGSPPQKKLFVKKTPAKRPGVSGDKPKKGKNPFAK